MEKREEMELRMECVRRAQFSLEKPTTSDDLIAYSEKLFDYVKNGKTE